MMSYFKNNWREVLIITVLLMVSGFLHAQNMFHFPFFENDEGTYFAQAWSVISEQKLAPYTYWYDHAPFGWLFTALWIILTGGLFSFGFALNSARVFMLVIHLLNVVLLYVFARQTTKSRWVGVLAGLLFSISPLAVYFQRRLLLDNLMVFWILLSLVFTFWKERLSVKVASAIAFALAVLTKENAIFFFPILAYFVWQESKPYQRVIVPLSWMFVAGSVIALYPLFALLKGELFPYGSMFSPDHPHVSLLGTLAMHAQRGTGLPFWNIDSDFAKNAEYWLSKDSLLMFAGAGTFIYHIFAGIWKKRNRVIALATLPMVLFLISGRLVINFYIIPVIPFLALCISLWIDDLAKGSGWVFKKIFKKLFVLKKENVANQKKKVVLAQDPDLTQNVSEKKYMPHRISNRKFKKSVLCTETIFTRNKKKVLLLQERFLTEIAKPRPSLWIKGKNRVLSMVSSIFTFKRNMARVTTVQKKNQSSREISQEKKSYWLSNSEYYLTHLIFVLSILFFGRQYAGPIQEYLHKDETTQQLRAVQWIQENLDPDSAISIDFYSYLDLQKNDRAGAPVFPNADWFWKVELDPDIREKKLHNDPELVNYMMVTAEVQRQVHTFAPDSLLRQVWDNSHVIAQFKNENNFYFDFNQTSETQEFPNGDWVVILQQNGIDLQQIWQTYRDAHIHPDGYVIMPGDEDSVITEAQAYALLRAVWMDDKETFDSVYNWTVEHMQLSDAHLFSWHWSHKDQSWADAGNATDADQDIALALIFASKVWGDEFYADQAQLILNDLWEHNVYSADQWVIITAGNWADSGSYLTLNPSYFAPYTYRIFAQFDQGHDWIKAVDSSYTLLDACSSALFGSSQRAYLPPEWCRFYKDTGTVAESFDPQPQSNEYGFNAFRVPWRVYLDYQWNGEPRAAEYLKKMSVPAALYQENENIPDVLSYEGTPLSESSKFGSVMNLPVVQIQDLELAKTIFEQTIEDTFSQENHYWLDGREYYLQNWYWFMLGLYQGELGNLYTE